MSYWLHCNACGSQKQGFQLSNCCHIFCHDCASKLRDKCSICGKEPIRVLDLTRDELPPEVTSLFKNVNQRLVHFCQHLNFQNIQFNNYVSILRKRIAALSALEFKVTQLGKALTSKQSELKEMREKLLLTEQKLKKLEMENARLVAEVKANKTLQHEERRSAASFLEGASGSLGSQGRKSKNDRRDFFNDMILPKNSNTIMANARRQSPSDAFRPNIRGVPYFENTSDLGVQPIEPSISVYEAHRPTYPPPPQQKITSKVSNWLASLK